MINYNDNISNILNYEKNISNYKLCHYGNNLIGILVMEYYKLNSIYDYKWSKNNFNFNYLYSNFYIIKILKYLDIIIIKM